MFPIAPGSTPARQHKPRNGPRPAKKAPISRYAAARKAMRDLGTIALLAN
jgi:hypothetical protein